MNGAAFRNKSTNHAIFAEYEYLFTGQNLCALVVVNVKNTLLVEFHAECNYNDIQQPRGSAGTGAGILSESLVDFTDFMKNKINFIVSTSERSAFRLTRQKLEVQLEKVWFGRRAKRKKSYVPVFNFFTAQCGLISCCGK